MDSGAAAPTSFHKSPNMQPAIQVGGQLQVNEQQQPAVIRDEPTAIIGANVQDQAGTISVIQQQQQQQVCLPQTSARNMYWNYTRAGHLTRQNCPDGSSGKVSWFCDSERLRFMPSWSPDFTQCRSNWLQRLAHQLDQMLEQQQQAAPNTGSGNKQPVDWQRQQSEQMLKVILNDLSLMASTKELFSEDLKRIDIMISQIIAQLKSLSVLYGINGNGATGSGWRSGPATGSGHLNSLYEELFNKLVNIISSLFDLSQRSAWLEIQPAEVRKKLEQRYLNHLKDSGVMLANSLGPFELEQLDPLQRQAANVFAAITVINGARLNSPLAPIDLDSNEFNFKQLLLTKQSQQQQQQQTILNRFVAGNSVAPAESDEQINEFRIHLSILRELVANGITRFLVLDIKKPDYSLIRHQLESAYANANGPTNTDSSSMDNNQLPGDQQWSSRVFGVFAILGENGDVLDGQPAADSAATSSPSLQQQNSKLAHLLSQWPISVDFKVPQSPGQLVTTSSSSATNYQLQAIQTPATIVRQCNPLSDNVYVSLQQAPATNSRCQTIRSNATNHICRCNQFGFVALTSPVAIDLQQQQQVPTNSLGSSSSQDLQWPPNGHQSDNSFDLNNLPVSIGSHQQRSLEQQQPPFMTPAYVGPQDKQQRQALSIWTIIFIVLGLSVFIVSLATFVINAIVRATSQCRLHNKKSGAHFLSTGTSILGGSGGGGGGPTTGPLADHSLISGEPLKTTGSSSAPTTSATSTTTQSSGSIIGLNGNNNTTCHAYKTHQQQLYAARYPALDGNCIVAHRNQNRWWTSGSSLWRRWLRPAHWFSGGSGASSLASQAKGLDHGIIGNGVGGGGGIQHCIVGHHPNLANQSMHSAAYKNHFQNGYTTGLHHHHHHQQLQSPLVAAAGNIGQTQKLPPPSLAAPSSASSYVSSSAYYEEIGPGNLTKVNPSQLTTNTHTIVEPFKRQPATGNTDQQQLLASGHQQQQHHHLQQQQQQRSGQQQAWSYQQQQQPDAQQLTGNYGPTTIIGGQQNNKHQLHSDLSQLQQSSSSSAGSTASTNVTTANGSTPRHYLFASPSAVNAYKSSMGQQQQQIQHQTIHQQQQQHLHHLQQQQHFQPQRFMPN